MFASVILLTCCSCGTSKHVTQLVRDGRVDTVYLSNMQYDSIYIFKDRYQDRSRDTVYLKDVSLEVKYKLLRDTVKVIQRDSVPYQITVTEVKEIQRDGFVYQMEQPFIDRSATHLTSGISCLISSPLTSGNATNSSISPFA